MTMLMLWSAQCFAFGENVNINFYGMNVDVDGQNFEAGTFIQAGQQVTMSPEIEVANLDDNYQDVGFLFFSNQAQMEAYQKGNVVLQNENQPFEVQLSDSDLNENGTYPVHYALYQNLEGGMKNIEYHTHYLPLESVQDWESRMIAGIQQINAQAQLAEDALVAQEIIQLNRGHAQGEQTNENSLASQPVQQDNSSLDSQ